MTDINHVILNWITYFLSNRHGLRNWFNPALSGNSVYLEAVLTVLVLSSILISTRFYFFLSLMFSDTSVSTVALGVLISTISAFVIAVFFKSAHDMTKLMILQWRSMLTNLVYYCINDNKLLFPDVMVYKQNCNYVNQAHHVCLPDWQNLKFNEGR